MIRQADLGEDDDPNDDVVADYVYSRESNGSSGIGGAGDQPHDRPSPIWNAGLCPTWVSLPVAITVTNGKTGGDYVEYRHRDGRGNICDNASVTHLEETIDGNGHVAETELTYDAWGSYDRIVYPVGQNGRRYAVQYVWDLDGHANIADVTEYDLDPSAVDNFLGDGLVPGTDVYTEGLHSSALFDPLTNLVASRTDANGNTVHYGYDALGRLASISSPVPTDPQPLVSFQYFVKPNDPHAVAHHYDAFHPGDTIDTAAFADGVGRVVQTQNDASLFDGGGQPATAGMIVSGATFFDALGRPYRQYNPTRGTTPLGTFDTNSPLPDTRFTETVYDLWDLPNTITEPGNRVTTIAYEYGQINGAGPTLYRTTETAPNGRKTVTFTDVRDVVRRASTTCPWARRRSTRCTAATAWVNCSRSPTRRATSRRTPTTRWAGARRPTRPTAAWSSSPTTPMVSRSARSRRTCGRRASRSATGTSLHRLMAIDYPGTADDVTYTYGGMGAPNNGAGQVVQSEDGSQIERNMYDPAGNIVSQSIDDEAARLDARRPIRASSRGRRSGSTTGSAG